MVRAWLTLPLLVLGMLFLPGCVRREGRNSECQWPPSPAGVHTGDLRADLEFAEDLAIRYMEVHSGPRDQAAAAQAKNYCTGVLLAAIGQERGMPASEVFQSFGQRSLPADLAMHLPFAFLYALVGDYAIRRLLARYPPSGGMTAVTLLVLAAVAFGIGGLLLGQGWGSLAESIRVGTTHLSNRELRLPMRQHATEAFLFAAALFLGIAFLRYRT